MNSTEQTPNSSAANYKQLLIQASELRTTAGKSAWKRATILCQVFDDSAFRADCGNIDDFRAAAILDDYVEDLCLGFFELRAMLKRFPKQGQWREGRLLRMYQEVLKDNDKSSPERLPRVPTAETKKELAKQLEVARQEKARIESERKTVEETLRETIVELEEENAQLRARVAELESLLSTEMTTA